MTLCPKPVAMPTLLDITLHDMLILRARAKMAVKSRIIQTDNKLCKCHDTGQALYNIMVMMRGVNPIGNEVLNK